MSYYVYRFYGRDDQLLYVGCTNDFDRRLEEHKTRTVWIRECKRWTMEEYSTKEEGLSAETRIIMSERPKYNVNGKRFLSDKKSLGVRRRKADWSGGDYYPSPESARMPSTGERRKKPARFTDFHDFR